MLKIDKSNLYHLKKLNFYASTVFETQNLQNYLFANLDFFSFNYRYKIFISLIVILKPCPASKDEFCSRSLAKIYLYNMILDLEFS